MTKRIFFITGARSDFDLMSPVIKQLENDDEIEASVIVCAAHLSPFHGTNIDNIRKDGFRIAGTIESLISSESWEGRSLSYSNLHDGLTKLLSEKKPDCIFVAGDREEALAGALVGCFLRIPVAHSHGGDRCLASDIDEVFRPAISKLANLHFVATQDHAERLVKMGEDSALIWNTGAAALDRWQGEQFKRTEQVFKMFNLSKSQNYFLVIHHPSPTLGIEHGIEEVREVLEATLTFGFPVFCSYPNFDPGNIGIRSVIDEYAEKHSNLIAYHNLPSEQFEVLYSNASAVLGNSSSIVTESGFLKIPGILVGRRQELRAVGPNVISCSANREEIIKSCKKCLYDEQFLSIVNKGISLYGDGSASRKIADILKTIDFKKLSLLKTITY